MNPLTVRSLGALLVCEAAWERAGPEAVHIFEPLDVDYPRDVDVYGTGSGIVRFFPADGCEVTVCHQRLMGNLVLLDDGHWYEVTAGQVVFRDGRWCLRWRGERSTGIARMLNACPPKVQRRALTHAGGIRP